MRHVYISVFEESVLGVKKILVCFFFPDFSDCDLSAAVGRATIITAGCCIIIAAVSGTIVYGMIRWNR